MKTYARIDNNVVAELFQTDGDIAQLFHPDLVWIDTGNTPVAIGDTYANGTFAAPAGPSLADRQATAWADIKAKRDAIQSGGVEVIVITGTSKWFQTDPTSRVQYLGLKDSARDMLAAGHVMSDALQLNGQPVCWKTFDNSFVALTLQNVFDIVAAVKTLDAAAFANAETHRAPMLKTDDPTTYDYSTGWPTVYTGA